MSTTLVHFISQYSVLEEYSSTEVEYIVQAVGTESEEWNVSQVIDNTPPQPVVWTGTKRSCFDYIRFVRKHHSIEKAKPLDPLAEGMQKAKDLALRYSNPRYYSQKVDPDRLFELGSLT